MKAQRLKLMEADPEDLAFSCLVFRQLSPSVVGVQAQQSGIIFAYIQQFRMEPDRFQDFQRVYLNWSLYGI